MDDQHRKISGYRDLNEEEITAKNFIKSFGPPLADLIAKLSEKGPDPGWVAIGKTHLQEGLMALTRAVAKPDFL